MAYSLRQAWWREVRWPLLVFVALAVLFSLTDADVAIARGLFFDAAHERWLGAHNWWIEAFLHTGGRRAIQVVVAAGLAIWMAASVHSRWDALRRPAAYFVVATVLGIGVVGLLKGVTNVDCPWDLLPFGGRFPLVPFFADRPDSLRAGHCFPAAHASSGYALVALYFVFRERSRVLACAGLWVGIACGVAFGLAQQARGAHFVSHDVWSAFIVWVIAASVYVFGFAMRLYESNHLGVVDGALDLVRDRLDDIRGSDGGRREAGAHGDLGGAGSRGADECGIPDRARNRGGDRAALGASIADSS
jgi:membrane-associated PAP2 superfamily phosphatase